MNFKHSGSFIEIAENLIRIGAPVTLAITVLLMGVALFDKSNANEAYIGSFETWEFNSGWQMVTKNGNVNVELPASISADYGQTVVLENTLPRGLSDGMNLAIRSTMEDVLIYVNGSLRAEYSSNTVSGSPYYVPSAFVVAKLYEWDSGKDIRMEIHFKARHIINGVKLYYGNNLWFEVIKSAGPVCFIALMTFVLGAVLSFAALFLINSFKVKAARNMGLLVMDLSLWIFSESTMRQIIFLRPSLSQFFSYYLVEMVGVFACLYFDEVQHRHYHKIYVVMESLALLQVFINIILNSIHVADYYVTMGFSHMWTFLCAVVTIINIIIDVRTKRVKEYHITTFGMILFIVISLSELLGFYLNRFHVFGTEISIAIVFLMAATVIQTIYDEIKNYNTREKNYTEMTIKTIETIASAIDAKDEYTGGHSERVGMYAQILAREMAADYDLSEDDILRIHYIGLVHDIGKIGVADDVLNKIGRLSDEEYDLMKKHVEIGYEMMRPLGNVIEGLLDGIRHHHERFDGKGYPDGLSDTDIPLVARILALADSYDAMTSNRVYRFRLSDDQVREELKQCSGAQFDPALTEIFLRLMDRKEIYPMTVEGQATDTDGNIRNSAMLERRLADDLSYKESIISPTHVRMLCYLMKLMERKGKDFFVIFIETKHDDDKFKEKLRKYISSHDVGIDYTDDWYLLALYDKTQQETEAFEKELNSEFGGITIEKLS